MKWIPVVAFALVVSACASASPGATPDDPTTTTIPPDPVLVLTITEDGGCFMMGPNCATYLVYSDGSLELQRTGQPGDPLDTTTIDVALVADVAALVGTTDLDALRAGLPPGECRGCYDGTDVTFTYETPDGPVAFAGTDVDIFVSEPLFTASWSVLETAASNTELPVVTRP